MGKVYSAPVASVGAVAVAGDGGVTSTLSSGAVVAVSLARLRSSQNKSEPSMVMTRMMVLKSPNRLRDFSRALRACTMASLRLSSLRLKRPHIR
jgi:hypothetical protein